MHTSTHFIILCKSYYAAIPEYFEPILLVNYVCVVVLTSDLQIVLFYSIIKFFKNSSII